MELVIEGVEPCGLAEVLTSGVDHGGNAVEPFIDDEGGWQLRCCLASSQVGERIAVIAYSPFPWHGPFRETGPIVVHADGCPGTWQQPVIPAHLDDRAMVLRPYGPDHKIAYEHVRHVGAGDGMVEAIVELLQHPHIAEVYARNPLAGCFAFTARRADS